MNKDQLTAEFSLHFAAFKAASKTAGDLTAPAWRGKDKNERQRKIRAYAKAAAAYEEKLKEFEARAEAAGLELWFDGRGSYERAYFLPRIGVQQAEAV